MLGAFSCFLGADSDVTVPLPPFAGKPHLQLRRQTNPDGAKEFMSRLACFLTDLVSKAVRHLMSLVLMPSYNNSPGDPMELRGGGHRVNSIADHLSDFMDSYDVEFAKFFKTLA